MPNANGPPCASELWSIPPCRHHETSSITALTKPLSIQQPSGLHWLGPNNTLEHVATSIVGNTRRFGWSFYVTSIAHIANQSTIECNITMRSHMNMWYTEIESLSIFMCTSPYTSMHINHGTRRPSQPCNVEYHDTLIINWNNDTWSFLKIGEPPKMVGLLP